MRKLPVILCILLMFFMLPIPTLAATYSPTELDKLRGVVEGILGEDYTYTTVVKWDSVFVEVENDQFYDLCDLVQSNPAFEDIPIIIQNKSEGTSLSRDEGGWFLVEPYAIPTDGETIPNPPATGDIPSVFPNVALLVMGVGAFALLATCGRRRTQR